MKLQRQSFHGTPCDGRSCLLSCKVAGQIWRASSTASRHNSRTCGCRLLSSRSSQLSLAAIQHQVDDILSTRDGGSFVSEKKTKVLCQQYQALGRESRLQFLAMLAREYHVDHDRVGRVAESLSSAKREHDDVGATLKVEERLRQVLTPRYQHLFTHISHLDSGVKFLVDLRADLLATLSSSPEGSGNDMLHMHAMNSCLRDHLSLCFSVGFLRLERITWQSPCDMLQKVSDYEAVHPVRSWEDMKQRVGAYRRCYVFTHHSMPREPIVVLHTALTTDIASSIQSIVKQSRKSAATSESHVANAHSEFQLQRDHEDTSKVNTAIFYSITSTLKGLQGVELGNYLIKRVVRELLVEMPHLSQFSSLSPIPGFRDWLIAALLHSSQSPDGSDSSRSLASLLTDSELVDIAKVLGVNKDSVLESLRKTLVTNSWVANDNMTSVLRLPLLRLCAHYLYNEKRRGFALNSVANFHLRNGAMLWRLNWLADRSARGLTASCGLMVNYRYFLDQTEDNSRLYVEKQTISISEQFAELLKR